MNRRLGALMTAILTAATMLVVAPPASAWVTSHESSLLMGGDQPPAYDPLVCGNGIVFRLAYGVGTTFDVTATTADGTVLIPSSPLDAPLVPVTYPGDTNGASGGQAFVLRWSPPLAAGQTVVMTFVETDASNPGFTSVFELTTAGCSVVLDATIDVLPFSSANRVRPGSPLYLPVAIFSTPSLDAGSIDPTTVRLGRAATARFPLLLDLNGDRIRDLLVWFRIADSGISCRDTSVTVTGSTRDARPLFAARPFAGSDRITTVGCA